MPLEAHQSSYVLAQGAELAGTAELGKIDDEGAAHHRGACPLQQLDSGKGSTAGGNEIVHDNHMITFDNGVAMNLHTVRAVFEIIILAKHGVRQLAFFAHRDEPAAKLVRHRAAQNESARLDARDPVNLHPRIGLHHLVHRAPERARVAEQGGDVAKHDPRLWVIGNRANNFGEIHCQTFLSTRPATASSFLNNSGSRLSGEVMRAVSSTCSMPSGDAVRSGPSFGATRFTTRRAFSALAVSTRIT